MGEEVMRNPPISPGPPSGLSGRGTIGVESPPYLPPPPSASPPPLLLPPPTPPKSTS